MDSSQAGSVCTDQINDTKHESTMVSTAPELRQLTSATNNCTMERTSKQVVKGDNEYQQLQQKLALENLKIQELTEQVTTMQALSNPDAVDIDRMFTRQINGLYLFIASASCCLDATSSIYPSDLASANPCCKHEFCIRARTTGLSWNEVDMIKLYYVRLRQEKTTRRRIALVKQRDAELSRMRKTDDEEQAIYSRRNHRKLAESQTPMATFDAELSSRILLDEQDLEALVFDARIAMMHIYTYQRFSVAHEIVTRDIEEYFAKLAELQELNTEIATKTAQQIRIQVEKVEEHAGYYAAKLAKSARSSRKGLSCFALMFSSDFEYDHLEPDAMRREIPQRHAREEPCTATRNGSAFDRPLAPLREYTEMPSHKTPARMMEWVAEFRQSIIKSEMRSKWSLRPESSGLDPVPVTLSQLRDCINAVIHLTDINSPATHSSIDYSAAFRVEEKAGAKMAAEFDIFSSDAPSIFRQKLRDIIDSAVSISPFMRLTEKMLDIRATTLHDMAEAREMVETLEETSDQALVVKIGTLVFARAMKKTERLTHAFNGVEAIFEAAYINPLPQRLKDALDRVRVSIENRLNTFQAQSLAQHKSHDDRKELAASEAASASMASINHPNDPELDKAEENAALKDDVFTIYEQSILKMASKYDIISASLYIWHLFDHNLCAGCACVRIARLHAVMLRERPHMAQQTIHVLNRTQKTKTKFLKFLKFLKDTGTPEVASWWSAVSDAVQAMVDIYNLMNSQSSPGPLFDNEAVVIGGMMVNLMESVVYRVAPRRCKYPFTPIEIDSIQQQALSDLFVKLAGDPQFHCQVDGYCDLEQAEQNSRAFSSSATVAPAEVAGTGMEQSKPQSTAAFPSSEAANAKNGVSGNETSTNFEARIVSGCARKRLLPRGERHLSGLATSLAVVDVACMGKDHATRMADFCNLQKAAYEQAGLPVPKHVEGCLDYIRWKVSAKTDTQTPPTDICPCPNCTAIRENDNDRSAKFSEDLLEVGKSEATINGRSLNDTELINYTSATVDRIRSISDGKAKFEYLCWVANKVRLVADAAQSAGLDWRKPILQFEYFFKYHAPMPRELELCLDHARGKLWRRSDYLTNYDAVEWPIIERILDVMGKITNNRLAFTDADGSWRVDGADFITLKPKFQTCDQVAELREEASVGGQINSTHEIPDTIDECRDDEQINRQAEFIRAQLTALEHSSHKDDDDDRADTDIDTPAADDTPPLTEEKLVEQFISFHTLALPLMDYDEQEGVADQAWEIEDDYDQIDPGEIVAYHIEMQYYDIMRTIQLVADAKGWVELRDKMAGALSDMGWKEDANGHMPARWGADGGHDSDDGT